MYTLWCVRGGIITRTNVYISLSLIRLREMYTAGVYDYITYIFSIRNTINDQRSCSCILNNIYLVGNRKNINASTAKNYPIREEVGKNSLTGQKPRD